jgi:drug/metabolite transporter (DMT)-like permease
MSLAFIAQLGIFITIIYMPLADATAFMFSKPLFTTIVAVFILSEIVSGRRWMATFVGFVGVLVMVRPGSAAMDPIALIAVGSAFTFAIANVLIRKLSTTEPPARILFYYHVFGIPVFAVPAFWVWVTPVGIEWLLMAGIGVFTTAGMFCYIRAFGTGEANAVGPAENLRLIYAALFGLFLFSEVPSIWTVIGATIIVAATYYIARSEALGRR